MAYEQVKQPSYRRLSADVLVAGGGPAGTVAAIAAAREGADVLLLEREGFLGGVATTGLILTWPINTGGEDQSYGGLPAEVLDRLASYGGLAEVEITDPPCPPYRWWRYDQELLKIVLDQMVIEARVRLLLHTYILGAIHDGTLIKSVQIANKSGIASVSATMVIDATGDADVAVSVGVPTWKGQTSDGRTAPMTTCFRLGGVDFELLDENTIQELFVRGQETGQLSIPHHYININRCQQGIVQVFATRIPNVDGTNAWDLTYAELEGRRQVMELFHFLKANAPGFANAFLLDTSTRVGVRETRRIKGDYILTGEDVRSGRKFPDGIAMGSYRLDIHNPSGPGTDFVPLGKNIWYEIPYRSLRPIGIDNLLIAGRAISGDAEAFSSYRVMPICMLMGQAAGIAAAMAVQERVSIRQVEVRRLRAKLRALGAKLSED